MALAPLGITRADAFLAIAVLTLLCIILALIGEWRHRRWVRRESRRSVQVNMTVQASDGFRFLGGKGGDQ